MMKSALLLIACLLGCAAYISAGPLAGHGHKPDGDWKGDVTGNPLDFTGKHGDFTGKHGDFTGRSRDFTVPANGGDGGGRNERRHVRALNKGNAGNLKEVTEGPQHGPDGTGVRSHPPVVHKDTTGEPKSDHTGERYTGEHQKFTGNPPQGGQVDGGKFIEREYTGKDFTFPADVTFPSGKPFPRGGGTGGPGGPPPSGGSGGTGGPGWPHGFP